MLVNYNALENQMLTNIGLPLSNFFKTKKVPCEKLVSPHCFLHTFSNHAVQQSVLFLLPIK